MDFKLEVQDENDLIAQKELEQLRADNAKAAGEAVAAAIKAGLIVYSTSTAVEICKPFFYACKFTMEELEGKRLAQFTQAAIAHAKGMIDEENTHRAVYVHSKTKELVDIIHGKSSEAVKDIFDQHYAKMKGEALICKICKTTLIKLGNEDITQMSLNFEEDQEVANVR